MHWNPSKQKAFQNSGEILQAAQSLFKISYNRMSYGCMSYGRMFYNRKPISPLSSLSTRVAGGGICCCGCPLQADPSPAFAGAGLGLRPRSG